MHLRRPQHKVGAGAGPPGFAQAFADFKSKGSGRLWVDVSVGAFPSQETCVNPGAAPALSQPAWPRGSPCRASAAPELPPPGFGLQAAQRG